MILLDARGGAQVSRPFALDLALYTETGIIELRTISAMDVAIDKRHAHDLLDQLDNGQLAAVVHLLEVMADPVARSLANAPVDDEPIRDEEARALDEAHEWLKHNTGIPHEQVLAEFGITQEEIENYQEPA
jgi:hypothetical protein